VYWSTQTFGAFDTLSATFGVVRRACGLNMRGLDKRTRHHGAYTSSETLNRRSVQRRSLLIVLNRATGGRDIIRQIWGMSSSSMPLQNP